MNELEKLAEAYDRVMRVNRIEHQIKRTLNAGTNFNLSDRDQDETVGTVIVLMNNRIQEIHGITYNKYADARERVFWRKP